MSNACDIGIFRCAAWGIAAFIFCLGIRASVSQADESSETPPDDAFQQVCNDSWDDAPASAFCTPTSLERLTHSKYGWCELTHISCSITVTVGSDDDAEQQTFTPGRGYFLLEPQQVDEIDICFIVDDTSPQSPEWIARVRQGCESGWTDSATATAEGLPALEDDTETGDVEL